MADAYAPLDTPVGPLLVAFNHEGISLVVPSPDDAELERAFQAAFGRLPRRVPAPPPSLARAVLRHVDGTARPSGLRFDLRRLTEFDRAVLLTLLEIPRGEVRSYAWVAREIGRPRATRAVGSANARNPIAVLIPCHRLIRSDGAIHKYLYGSDMKRALLAYEGADPDRIERLSRLGVRFFGSDTTRIFCFPTCRHARRTTDRHLVRFASAPQAAEAGYRPCNVCRPAARAS